MDHGQGGGGVDDFQGDGALDAGGGEEAVDDGAVAPAGGEGDQAAVGEVGAGHVPGVGEGVVAAAGQPEPHVGELVGDDVRAEQCAALGGHGQQHEVVAAFTHCCRVLGEGSTRPP
nr:hypothetical protein [Streptomyces natalensis]